MTDCNKLPVTEKTECYVREYFESRGWLVEKLDTGKESAADFSICKEGVCFLCEVKTIESVHANLPWAPSLSVFETEREERQARNKQFAEENPDSRLVLNPTDYEFTYGDPKAFRQKYQNRPRFTESQFKEFANEMRKFFTESPKVRYLPFSIRLDSDDLYVPFGDKRTHFFEWLESELVAIVNGSPPDCRWHIKELPYGTAHHFFMHYPIHYAERENDAKAKYSLSITGPNYSDRLDIQIFSYGQLNQDAIGQNIESGLRQLSATGSRERFQGNAQVIVLAFAGGLSFEWDALLPYLSWLLQQNPTLNGIVVLDHVPEGEPPDQQQEGIEAFLSWIGSSFTQSWEARFVVVHNTWHPNEHNETIAQAFDHNKNAHIEAHTIKTPPSWLLK